eukprot:364628-Chlamydomonas_euryale.AAC.2
MDGWMDGWMWSKLLSPMLSVDVLRGTCLAWSSRSSCVSNPVPARVCATSRPRTSRTPLHPAPFQTWDDIDLRQLLLRSRAGNFYVLLVDNKDRDTAEEQAAQAPASGAATGRDADRHFAADPLPGLRATSHSVRDWQSPHLGGGAGAGYPLGVSKRPQSGMSFRDPRTSKPANAARGPQRSEISQMQVRPRGPRPSVGVRLGCRPPALGQRLPVLMAFGIRPAPACAAVLAHSATACLRRGPLALSQHLPALTPTRPACASLLASLIRPAQLAPRGSHSLQTSASSPTAALFATAALNAWTLVSLPVLTALGVSACSHSFGCVCLLSQHWVCPRQSAQPLFENYCRQRLHGTRVASCVAFSDLSRALHLLFSTVSCLLAVARYSGNNGNIRSSRNNGNNGNNRNDRNTAAAPDADAGHRKEHWHDGRGHQGLAHGAARVCARRAHGAGEEGHCGGGVREEGAPAGSTRSSWVQRQMRETRFKHAGRQCT